MILHLTIYLYEVQIAQSTTTDRGTNNLTTGTVDAICVTLRDFDWPPPNLTICNNNIGQILTLGRRIWRICMNRRRRDEFIKIINVIGEFQKHLIRSGDGHGTSGRCQTIKNKRNIIQEKWGVIEQAVDPLHLKEAVSVCADDRMSFKHVSSSWSQSRYLRCIM